MDKFNAKPTIIDAALLVAAAECIEIYITGLRDASYKIHFAVPVSLPAYHLACLSGIIREISVYDFDFSRVLYALLRGYDPFLYCSGGYHQLEN